MRANQIDICYMKEKMDPIYKSMHPMLDPLEALYVSIHAIQTWKDLEFEVIKDNFDNIFGSDSRAVSSGGALLVDGAFETSSSISALRVSLVWAKAPVGVARYYLLRHWRFPPNNNNNKQHQEKFWITKVCRRRFCVDIFWQNNQVIIWLHTWSKW